MRLLPCVAFLLSSAAVAAAERPIQHDKSEIAFTVTQMGVGVSGTFTRYAAKINLDTTKPDLSTAEIVVDTASISTGDEDTDDEAVKKPWLDVSGFPKAQFKSSSIRPLGGGKYEASGMLTLKGKPRTLK